MQERTPGNTTGAGSGFPCDTTRGCSGKRAGNGCDPCLFVETGDCSGSGSGCAKGREPEAGRSSST